MATLGDQLVVGVGRHVRHPASAADDEREPGVGRDRALEPLFRRPPELRRVVLAKHDADGEPLLEWNTPAPARLAAGDPHLARRVVPAEALEVREVRDVLAGPEPRGNPERAGREARASGGIDDQIGLTREARCCRDRLGGEPQLGARFTRGVRLELDPGGHVVDAGGDRLGEQRVVEMRAGDVVGVREDRGREAIERHAHPVRVRPDERDAGLDAAEARGLLFEVESLEDRHHSRNE